MTLQTPIAPDRPMLSADTAMARIRAILAGPMGCPHLAAFRPEARLGPDLGLDSVALMTLMLHLEETGLPMAEDTFDRAPGLTVRALAEALVGTPPAPGEEPLDIKVHCVVSCFCQALKDRGGIDHRPLYLGLWDGEVVLDDRMRLSYHAAGLDHGLYTRWATRLFGLEITRWHGPDVPTDEALRRLHAQLAAWQPGRYVMPMLDLFLLPARENRFRQDPFPHYALIEPTADPDTWLMRDPDFRWEGLLPAADLRAAFLRPTVAGGFALDNSAAHPARPGDIAAFYRETCDPDDLPLIERLHKVLAAHAGPLPRADLEPALRELPVIAIRKYAYEHAFALFGEIEGRDAAAFEAVCDEIAALHGGLNAVHRRAVAYARGGARADLDTALARLDSLARTERAIKTRLHAWFLRWSGASA